MTRLLRNLVVLALVLGFAFIVLKLITPMIAWAFNLILTLALLAGVGIAVVYLYRKLRT